MSTKTILRICILMILSVFFLNPSPVTIAEDSQCVPAPTSAGNAERQNPWCDCTGEKPSIEADYSEGMDTIDSDHPVTLTVTGGCPGYKWSTTSKGYHLSSDEGETVILSVESGTCVDDFDIVAIVTVEDSCNPPTTITIRHSSGDWGPETRIYTCPVAGDGEVTWLEFGQWDAILISGDKKYRQRSTFEYSHTCSPPPYYVTSCENRDGYCGGSEGGFEWEPCITDPDDAYIVPCMETSPCSDEHGGDLNCYTKRLYESTWVCQY